MTCSFHCANPHLFHLHFMRLQRKEACTSNLRTSSSTTQQTATVLVVWIYPKMSSLDKQMMFCEKMERSFGGRCSRPLPRRIRSSPYPLRSYRLKAADEVIPKRALSTLALEKKDWEDATCSVCMEFPHNAVLLLCSSHDKGCRPYMCGTGYRHSNCLDQFKKAYTKIHDESAPPPPVITGEDPKPEPMELAACPLCRGQVKGWTVVEAAREYLNKKKRSCMQDACSFAGTYKELQKHVKSEHPCAKPREVDPMLEQKWRRLEHEREREDVISTIRSSMPRSVVFGDYVIEMANSDLDDSEEDEFVVGGDGGDGSGRGMSRNILYFFLREGARLMRLGRDDGDDDDDVNGDPVDVLPPIAGNNDDFGADSARRGRSVAVMEAERRRRRRRRSRRRSVVSLS